MPSSNERLVYYSLATGPRAGRAISQLGESVASLRAHDAAIPVRLYVYGALDAEDRAALLDLGVAIEDAGPYEDALRRFCSPSAAEVFVRLPVLHYLTSLARIVEEETPRQVLYLDGDTHFFGPVSALFDRYASFDLSAREEPLSRRSVLGHRPDLFDEAGIEALAAREGARMIAPFNNGVVLLSPKGARALAARVPEILRDVFRFCVWLCRRPGAERDDDLGYLRESFDRLVTPEDERAALDYPLRSRWIKDQLALWLAVGRMEDVRLGLFSPRDVMQGDEFVSAGFVTQTVAHYFSANTAPFTAWRERRADPPPTPPAATGAGMDLFDALGARVEDAWQRAGHDERAFPAIAAGLLREARLPDRLGALDVVRWLFKARRLPEQDDLPAAFGEPPITVYAGERFFIQVILWMEGSTALHRHAFSGAFQVLEGSSLHARYAFELRRRVNAGLLLGDLRLLGAEVLDRGAVVPIENDLIHSLFHLDAPSATVVVRTKHEREAQPQYDYALPFVAYDRDGATAPAVRRGQALRFLFRAKTPGWEALAGDLLGRADLDTTWHLLHGALRQKGLAAEAAPLFAAARKRHGPVFDELRASLEEELRRRAVGRLRASVTDPEERFFLALLQNLPDRRSIEAMVAARFPGAPPRERVRGFLTALSGADRIGVELGDALNCTLVEAMLDGCSGEALLTRLATVFGRDEVLAQREALERHAARIRATALAPLFVP